MNHNLPSAHHNNWQKKLLVVLILISAIRLAPLTFWYNDLRQDPDAYAAFAEGWAASGTFGRLSQDENGNNVVYPSAYRPPLYPYLLSWLTHSDLARYDSSESMQPTKLSCFAVAILHWIIGVSTCWLSIGIARLILRNENLSLLAGLFVAVDPILLRQSSLVMTETLATFLTVAFWYWWCRGDLRLGSLIVGGILLGFGILCRPTAAAWALTLIAFWMLTSIKEKSQPSLRQAVIIALACIATITPWVLRNAYVFGKPMWATTHGGYTLLLANNPVLFQHLSSGSFSRNWDEDFFHERWTDRAVGDPQLEEFWQRDQQAAAQDAELKQAWKEGFGESPWLLELKEDRFARETALSSIQRYPKEFALSIPQRLGWLWALWPLQPNLSEKSKIAIGIWYSGIFGILILALIGISKPMFRLRSHLPKLAPGILAILSVTLVHSIYWSNMRMRSVAMPAIYILLIFAIEQWHQHPRGGQAKEQTQNA